MLNQCWVTNGDISLAAVSHQPIPTKNNPGVVLISGFSQSMCDTDYFMAKLARRLAIEGIYVLQVDPRGHGDSPGYLEEVTLDTLRADIKNAINYAGEQSGGKIICVGRGLTATLMAEQTFNSHLYGVAGINPYCLSPAIVKDLFNHSGSGIFDTAYIDTAHILTGNDFKHFSDFDHDWMAFFDALGAGLLLNLLGQKISVEILRELMEYESYPVLKTSSEAMFWLISNKKEATGMYRWTPDEDRREQYYRTLPEYYENPFPSDPLWQHNAIERIYDWIAVKRGELDANTGSDRR